MLKSQNKRLETNDFWLMKTGAHSNARVRIRFRIRVRIRIITNLIYKSGDKKIKIYSTYINFWIASTNSTLAPTTNTLSFTTTAYTTTTIVPKGNFYKKIERQF